MKRQLLTSVCAAMIVWVILCITFSQHNAAADGVDKLGWPLPFYLHYEGKMFHWIEPPGFIFINLLADIGMVVLLSAIIFSISTLLGKRT